MFGKRNSRKHAYLQKSLEGTDKNDNIVLQSSSNRVSVFSKQGKRPNDNRTTSLSNMKTYTSGEGLVDNSGVPITYNKDPLFKEDLFLHYEADVYQHHNTLIDKSGNNLHGINNGSIDIISDDNFISVIDFDGSDEYIDVGTISNSYFTNGFTFCGWINYNDLTNFQRIFDFNSGNDVNNRLIFDISNNKYRIVLTNTSGSVFLNKSSLFEINANIYNFVCLILYRISGTYYIKIYVNGILDLDTTVTNTYDFSIYNRNICYIGRKTEENQDYIEGQMFDLRFYSRPLSSEEILQVYNESLYRNSKIVQQPNIEEQLQKDLVVWLKMDEEDSGTINNYGNESLLVTPINSPTITKSYKNNMSIIEFDDTNNYVKVENPSTNLANDLTISIWFKMNSSDSNMLISKTFRGEFDVRVDNLNSEKRIQFYCGDGNNYNDYKVVYDIINNKYYHLVITRTGNTDDYFYAHINNIKYKFINTGNNVNINVNSSAYDIFVGTRNNNGSVSGGLDCSVGEVRIYNRVLTDVEISSLYIKSFEKYRNLHTNMELSPFSMSNQFSYSQSTNLINFNAFHKNRLMLQLTAENLGTYGDSITDYSGYAHQGSKINITLESTSGIIDNKALTFNGTTSYITCSNPTSYDYAFKGLSEYNANTYSGWIYMDNLNENQPLLSYGNKTTDFNEYYQFYINTDGRLVVELSTQSYIFAHNFSVTTWYYIVVVLDKENKDVFNPAKYLKAYYATTYSTSGLINNVLFDYSNNDLDYDDDLFIHLPMDNNTGGYTKDVSNGSKYNGQINNGSDGSLGLTGDGPYGNKVLEFDGTNDDLDLPSISKSFFTQNKCFMFLGWINVSSIGINNLDKIIDLKNNTDNDNKNRITIDINNTSSTQYNIRLYIKNNFNADLFPPLISTLTLNTNKWYHITCIIQKETTDNRYNRYLYINGILDNSGTTTGISYNFYDYDKTNNKIGSYTNGSFYYFPGKMFDLRLYSRVLTDEEINKIYNSTRFITGYSIDNTSLNKLQIGKYNTSYFDGMMNDIRLYHRSLKQEELEYIWNSGSGSYTRGSNLLNSAMVQYTSGNHLILNSKVLNQISDEITSDSNRKLINDGLLMWYIGDENVSTITYDYSGNGFNGTNSTSVMYTNFNVNNKYKLSHCLDFDGTNDYVTVPTLSGSYFANGFTITCWVNFNNITGRSWERIFDFGNGQSNDNILIAHFSTSTTIRFDIYNGSSRTEVLEVSNYFNNNTWVFISVTTVSGSNKLYKNGSLVSSNSTTYPSPNVTRTSNFIGKSNWQSDLLLDGQISDFRMYSRILSAEEIRKQYLDKVNQGFLLNEAKTDTHSLRIMDNTHITSASTSRVSGILEPTLYNFGSTEDKLSCSAWIYPEYQQSGTIVSNAKSSSALAQGDWAFGIEPIAYEDMFIWITGNDITLNQTSTSSAVTSVYNSADSSITITPTNSPTSQTGPYRNNIIDFDGINDNLTVSTISGSYFTNGFSFSGWIKFINNDGWRRIFDFTIGENYNNNIRLFRNNSTTGIVVDISNGTNFSSIDVQNSFTVGEWFHVSFSFDNNTRKVIVYINGINRNSSILLYNIDTTVNRTTNYIGRSTAGDYFPGQMFDLRWYSRVLSNNEIKQIYQRTQNLVFKYHNGTNLQYQTSKIPISLKEWTHLGFNYSKADGIIELYQNKESVCSWNISSGIPSLNTDEPIIGAMQYSSKNRNVFQGEICDLIIKPDITLTETLESVYNMDAKCILDLKVNNIYIASIQEYLHNKLIYDSSIYTEQNSQNTSQSILGHTIENINITDITSVGGMDNAIQFNGSDDYIELSGVLSKNPIYNFNISVWIYPDESKTFNNGYIIAKWGSLSSDKIFRLRYDFSNDNLEFKYNTFNINNIDNIVSLTKNKWSYISINYINKEGSYIYVNGNLVSVKHDNSEINDGRYNSSGSTLYTEEDIFIGSDYNQDNYYKGYLKDIKFYKGVLSQKTIKSNYNSYINNNIINIKNQSTETTTKNIQNPKIDIISNLVLNIDTSLISNISTTDGSLLTPYIQETSQYQRALKAPENSNIFITTGFDETANTAIYFDNTINTNNSYIYSTSTPTLKADNISVSMWMKYSSTSGSQTIFRNGAVGSGYGLEIVSGEIKLTNSSTSISCSPSTLMLDTNTWYNLIYTCDSGINNIYLDGIRYVFTSNNNLNIPSSVFSIASSITETIGLTSYTQELSNDFTGYIQDFRVYDNVLTDNEIFSISLNNTLSNEQYISEEIIYNKTQQSTSDQPRVFTSKYSTDTNNIIDVPLPVISRDNLLVHYSPDSYSGSGTTLPDINHSHKSKYLYENVTFTDKYHGAITYDATLSSADMISTTEHGIMSSNTFYFDGSSGSIVVADGANLDTNSGNEWSISCWIKPYNLSMDSGNTIWIKTNAGSYTTGAVKIVIMNNILYLGINGENIFDIGVVIPENQWSLLTTTYGQVEYTENIFTQYVNNIKVYENRRTISNSSPDVSDILQFNDTISYPYNYYIVFDISDNNSGNIVQLAEINFYTDSNYSTKVYPVSATNLTSNNPSGETVDKIYDNNKLTKWLDSSGPRTIIYFTFTISNASTPSPQYYSLTTANDYPSRDPYTWTIRYQQYSYGIASSEFNYQNEYINYTTVLSSKTVYLPSARFTESDKYDMSLLSSLVENNITNYYSGYIDNIQIWNTKLHSGEIERLYNKLLTSGPLHHWIADNTTTATSNIISDLGFGGVKLNASTATISSTVTKINNSVFSFNGSSEYATAGTIGVSRDNPRTYSVWIYPTSTSTTMTIVNSGNSSTDGEIFRIGINTSNKLEINLGTSTILSTNTISQNQWSHICVILLPRTFHSSSSQGTDENIRIFINGRHTTDTSTYNSTILNTTITSTSTTTVNTYFGATYTSSFSNYFNGYMDDIRIYKVALSYDEIINLYNNSRNYKMLLL